MAQSQTKEKSANDHAAVSGASTNVARTILASHLSASQLTELAEDAC